MFRVGNPDRENEKKLERVGMVAVFCADATPNLLREHFLEGKWPHCLKYRKRVEEQMKAVGADRVYDMQFDESGFQRDFFSDGTLITGFAYRPINSSH